MPDTNDHYRSGSRGHAHAHAHAHAPALDVLVDTASVFAGSRISSAAAVTWAIFIAVIAISGLVVGILVAVK